MLYFLPSCYPFFQYPNTERMYITAAWCPHSSSLFLPGVPAFLLPIRKPTLLMIAFCFYRWDWIFPVRVSLSLRTDIALVLMHYIRRPRTATLAFVKLRTRGGRWQTYNRPHYLMDTDGVYFS